MVHRATPAGDRARPEGLHVLTLGQAAKLAGTSKTTLTRAIRAGRLSATRRDDGGYAIDPPSCAASIPWRLRPLRLARRPVTWCTTRPP